jgi:large subunit ribosomal protein L3
MIEGLLGRKLGMVQTFDKDGAVHGVTVIEAGPCIVTQLRTPEKDGYQAAQLGFGAAKRLTKPARGHVQKHGNLRHLREFKVDDLDSHTVGDKIGVEIFHDGDRVDVTATSKGRGFAGGVKRHNFSGGPKTHGQSDRHRAPGSIGAGNTPGRVIKGLRMAGHMGAEQVTVKNLEVVQSDPARGLLFVKGAVPGPKDGLVRIRYSRETLAVARGRKPLEVEAPAAEDEETAVAEETEAAAVAEDTAEQPEASAEAPAEATAGEEPVETEAEAPAEEAEPAGESEAGEEAKE